MGKVSHRGLSRCGLDGAFHLHGCAGGMRTYSAAHIERNCGGQRHLETECRAIREDLSRERLLATQRTIDELSASRWPFSAWTDDTRVHGARAAACQRGPQLAQTVAVFIAAHAEIFLQSPHAHYWEQHLCLALYPGSLRKPCYELQLASIRLMQHQLQAAFPNELVLLVAVGSQAEAMSEQLMFLLCGAPADAVPLRRAGVEEAPPPPGVAWSLQDHAGAVALSGLLNPVSAERLCAGDELLREAWAQLRLQLLEVMPASTRPGDRKRKRSSECAKL